MSDHILCFPPPSETQKKFLTAKAKYVAFGGARGGGKSWAVRVKACLLCLRYPGISVCIIRKSYPELVSNHTDELKKLLNGIAEYKEQKKQFCFGCGSVISLRFCAVESDLDKFQGQQYDVLFIDEATQISEEMYKKLTACVRGVNGFPKRVYLTCNPGGVGHGYVKRLFIDRAFTENEDPEDYVFIRSLLTDNKALMRSNPDYYKQLSSLPPKLRRAWLDGDFNIFEGQFFEEFRSVPDLDSCSMTGKSAKELIEERRYCHVIEPFEVPDSWGIYRSFDWGYSKPFSCDWWAIDHDGRAYLILQLYGSKGEENIGVKWDADRVFSEISRIEREHRWLRGKTIFGVADSAIWARDGGEAIIEAADRHQVYFARSDKKRIPGWMQCHYRLAFDEEGRARVYFFSTCKHAIRTLPTLQFDKNVPEDLDTEGEDHFADSFRYFCMSMPIPPERSAYREGGDDPLDLCGKVRYKRFSYT